jgi:hypothetical protein
MDHVGDKWFLLELQAICCGFYVYLVCYYYYEYVKHSNITAFSLKIMIMMQLISETLDMPNILHCTKHEHAFYLMKLSVTDIIQHQWFDD